MEYSIIFAILLQHRWEVPKKYAIFRAPAGYLIDERGFIAKDVE